MLMTFQLPFARVLLAGLLPLVALAQAPTITAVSPAPNTRAANPTGPVNVSFSQPLTAASTGALRVFSSQRGGQRTVAAPTALAGNTLSYMPPAAMPFAPGEVMQVSVTRAAASSGGSLAPPRVSQFSVATGAGSLPPAVRGAPAITRASTGALGNINGDGDLDLVTNNN
jgi:hypothetical protein